MTRDRHLSLLDEAEKCRRQALAYVGKPEGPFLLRIAKAFEELDHREHRNAALRGGL